VDKGAIDMKSTNAETADRRRWAGRTASIAILVPTVVVSMLLVAGCGGSSGAKVAQIGTTSTTKNTGSSNTSNSGNSNPAAYSACMRSHGVGNFPDPDSQGRIKVTSGVSANGQKIGVDVNSPQFKKARQACQKLMPNGGRPTAAQQAEEQQQMLKFAQCMRSNGVPKFPDPKAGGALTLGGKFGVDPNTPQFQAAQKTCQKLVPGGPIEAPPGSAPKP
jgi:hypothetical protein